LTAQSAGGTRCAVRPHAVQRDGLVVANVAPIATEPATALGAAQQPLAELLGRLAAAMQTRLAARQRFLKRRGLPQAIGARSL
jgi:hypothetical protein